LIDNETIVIGRVGACGAVNMAKAPAWISDNAMYVSALSDQVDLLFLYYGLIRLDLSQLAKIVAQPSISQEPIKEQKIPLPPLEEQKRLVVYLDKIHQKAQALQKLQEETEKEVEMLREAILYKAFRGEL
jgi:type I restriction enzyme S subunit